MNVLSYDLNIVLIVIYFHLFGIQIKKFVTFYFGINENKMFTTYSNNFLF